MQIVYLREARSALKRLPAHLRDRFLEALQAIAAGEGEALDVKPLHGRSESRLRIGAFRAIFRIDGDRLTVTQIGARGDVYKR
jgi:mRNA interferase RelE/StbE